MSIIREIYIHKCIDADRTPLPRVSDRGTLFIMIHLAINRNFIIKFENNKYLLCVCVDCNTFESSRTEDRKKFVLVSKCL